jgi:hypothetical protein
MLAELRGNTETARSFILKTLLAYFGIKLEDFNARDAFSKDIF